MGSQGKLAVGIAGVSAKVTIPNRDSVCYPSEVIYCGIADGSSWSATGRVRCTMRIGVVSDTHDRGEMVSEAVRLLLEQHVELLLHCGDIESTETVRLFKPIPTHFVFGNWDKDRAKLAIAIRDVGGIPYDSFGAIELAGKRIAWVHSHERHQLRQLEHSDFFDYLFYGHTHVREQHRTGRTLVANPGALFRANPKTCIVLDVETGEIKPIMVPIIGKHFGSSNGSAPPEGPISNSGEQSNPLPPI